MTLPSIPPASAGAYAQCTYFALSGDGNTLIRNCSDGHDIHKYVHTGPSFTQTARFQSEGGTYGIDLSYDGTRTLLQDVQGAYSFVLGSGGWQQDGYLPDGEGEHDLGERRIALSRDGKIAAIGTYGDRRVGLGPLYPPYQLGTQETANGGVMVYQRKATGWAFRRLVKPGSANVGWAGFAVSLGQNGNVLAVGAPFDSSAATGIDGNRDDTSALNRGAVWLY